MTASDPEPDDLDRWTERAAIREHEGAEPRRQAELAAWGEVLEEARERIGSAGRQSPWRIASPVD